MFDTFGEAEALLNYIKTKFLRMLLSVKKGTQHTPKSVWTMIPMQDFSKSSGIDWQSSIKKIDDQLYSKYNFTSEEIDFINKNVQSME